MESSLGSKLGDQVGLLFTEDGQAIPQTAFDELKDDFAASGQRLIGVPAVMLTDGSTVRDVRVSLEKQGNAYIFDEDDPEDKAPARRYSLFNQIRLLKMMAFMRDTPAGMTWEEYIATPKVRMRLDEIAAELNVKRGPNPDLHKPRHMLAMMVDEVRKKELADPNIETVEARLARLEKLNDAVNKLVRTFLEEKLRRAKQKPSDPETQPELQPQSEPQPETQPETQPEPELHPPQPNAEEKKKKKKKKKKSKNPLPPGLAFLRAPTPMLNKSKAEELHHFWKEEMEKAFTQESLDQLKDIVKG
jgi:hypothetical protein